LLGGRNCPGSYGQIWLEWESYQSCGDAETAKLLINREKGIEFNYLEGNFVGKFFVKREGESGFGHGNARDYKLVASCIENANLLPEENSGCQRVDKTSPFHYLEYVKTELNIPPNYQSSVKKKKKERIVWFRLVNNSSCSIVVPTVKNKEETLQNEAKILVVYKLEVAERTRTSIRQLNTTTIAPQLTDISPTSSILTAGNSIYFAVPLRYFQENIKVWRNRKEFWSIIVPFKYTDRQAEENYDPFYFSWRDLPKDLQKK
jgi:hypothetical protein